MNKTIVSGNKPSSVAQHQNHAKCLSKWMLSTLNGDRWHCGFVISLTHQTHSSKLNQSQSSLMSIVSILYTVIQQLF